MRTLQLLALALLATGANADQIKGYVTTELGNGCAGEGLPAAMNDRGWIVGTCLGGDGSGGELWIPNGTSFIQPLSFDGPGEDTDVLDINSAGDILAFFIPDVAPPPFMMMEYGVLRLSGDNLPSNPDPSLGYRLGFQYPALVPGFPASASWDPVVIEGLVDLPPSQLEDWSYWHPDSSYGANEVNKRGQFFQACLDCGGNFDISGYLYTPDVPEPSTLLLLATAGLAFHILHRRARNRGTQI